LLTARLACIRPPASVHPEPESNSPIQNNEEYISLTDIARKFNEEQPSSLIVNWIRLKDTIEFMGVWEKLHNTSFNLIEFDRIKSQTGTNRFIIATGTWIVSTNAIGLQTKSGRYGGTYAHKDIALAFCYWLSPPFQLYIIKEFQRLKAIENNSLDWNIKRTLAKINYRIHTDAVQMHLLPPKIKQAFKQENSIYAEEADVLNVALFGITAKKWKEINPNKIGNIRDEASSEQLLVLSNLENLNAEFIKQGLSQKERLHKLNQIAIYQIQILLKSDSFKKLNKL
jgi:hypothetical protein